MNDAVAGTSSAMAKGKFCFFFFLEIGIVRISADLNLADLGFWERGLCLKERD